ncbi:ARM repeat-containing protein [Trametes coccinea BRFM310]|uniref:ARM repeat-containing protein n=1 Tax=Trametes coccinea (strain BRFM310) TaxID=1353009 RepID=A0A1Y2J5K3_TRAC3|nr:ARM repeat-containing protein [Trametes coccinea BRFM310]
MDVPFSSSGAMSRAHYALVRKIEAATPHAADQLLLAEVDRIRHQLGRSTLTMKQSKESLILLLYCAMTVNPGVHVDLEFALPHAINLAEAGQTVQDKRTGYLFCAEVMLPEHELQLMLVNSIRKDLDSTAVSRICLALDILIQTPSKDVIPAVQSRLHDLLSHNSVDVRRRALFAYDRLSEHDRELLRDIVPKVRKRLGDHEPSVIIAALTLCETMVDAGIIAADQLTRTVSGMLTTAWSQRPDPKHVQLLVKLLQCVGKLSPSTQNVQDILDIVRYYIPFGLSAYAVVHQCFRAISRLTAEQLLEAQSATDTSFIHEIRQLLTSDEPNSLYLFVNSLASVDPKLWAGTDPAIPAVLEEWEVERVMKLLESEDKLIRKQTLQTLWRVDPSIVESYYARVLQGELPIPSEHFLPRLFEILDVICGNDGEAYAHQLKNALKSVEGDRPLNKRPVLQDIVEESLTRTHSRDGSWRSSWIGVLFTTLIDQEAEVGPTLMVILTALLCEYSELSPISPVEMLRGLAERMPAYSPAIQDVCLVTMLRLAGACEEVPAPVQEAVNRLHAQAGRHIQRRCDLFNSLVQSKNALKHIITDASSSSLPDFAVALEKYATDQRRAVSRSPSTLPTSPALKPRSPEPSSSRTSPTPSKLRYAAYDPPRPTHRLRRVSSGSSRHSDEGSVRSMGHSRANDDPMTMTVTPGDLTLAAQTSDLRSIASGSPRSNLSPLPVVQVLDEDASAPDLIALDSPFIPEPTQSIASTLSEAEHDFESTWNALESSTSRGWCEASIDTVLRKLQALHRRLKVTERDRSPFEGDLKIVVCPDTLGASPKGLAAIRLKESDDDSCLWWLRCEDEELRNIIKATLR